MLEKTNRANTLSATLGANLTKEVSVGSLSLGPFLTRQTGRRQPPCAAHKLPSDPR